VDILFGMFNVNKEFFFPRFNDSTAIFFSKGELNSTSKENKTNESGDLSDLIKFGLILLFMSCHLPPFSAQPKNKTV
jgi:hypothetical protein